MHDEAELSHTNWSLIFATANRDQAAASAAMERLVRRYWPAVYAYLRQTGRSAEEAADLTQSFVCDVVLLRQLFQKADPARGRFRTLLLTSLKNFVKTRMRSEQCQKRAPDSPLLHLRDNEVVSMMQQDLSPEQAFVSQWNATMIRRALERVRASCVAAGLEQHWRVFESRAVRPMLFGDSPIPYAKLVDLLDLDDSGQAANMMVTIKRRFVHALMDEIGCTVNDPLEIEQELRELLREMEVKA